MTTLILSRNNISRVNFLRRAPARSLRKISLSHNNLTSFNLNEQQVAWVSENLQELRLTDNLLSKLPMTLSKLNGLRLLDLGRNSISQTSDVKCLGSLKSLAILNLRGNPIAEDGEYKNKVLKMVGKKLEILDGRRLSKGKMKIAKKTVRGIKKPCRISPYGCRPHSSEDGDTSSETEALFRKELSKVGKLAPYNPFDELERGNLNADFTETNRISEESFKADAQFALELAQKNATFERTERYLLNKIKKSLMHMQKGSDSDLEENEDVDTELDERIKRTTRTEIEDVKFFRNLSHRAEKRAWRQSRRQMGPVIPGEEGAPTSLRLEL
mmetsp:Transcript_20454/g.28540  ORF Transcript_20454/g.28540 Transcript_20454/m.28540 type:complete len:328 (-) Transcript_20454:77-1060(-)